MDRNDEYTCGFESDYTFEKKHCRVCGRTIEAGEKYVEADEDTYCCDCCEELGTCDLLDILGFATVIELIGESSPCVRTA